MFFVFIPLINYHVIWCPLFLFWFLEAHLSTECKKLLRKLLWFSVNFVVV